MKEALRMSRGTGLRWRGRGLVGTQRVLTQPLWGCCRQPHATLWLTDSASRWQPHACSERCLGPQQPQHTFQVGARGGRGGAADQDRSHHRVCGRCDGPSSITTVICLGSPVTGTAPAITDCPRCRVPLTELTWLR